MNTFTRIRNLLMPSSLFFFTYVKGQDTNSPPSDKTISFSGILVDSSDKGVPYAGMGIQGKNTGTISDSAGTTPVFLIPAALSLSHAIYTRSSSEDNWVKVPGNTSIYVTLFD